MSVDGLCPLLTERHIYKPFRYPWAYEQWLKQQRIHWIPQEIGLEEDTRDWKLKLTDIERHLLTQIFRFFTQADVEVNNCYMKYYSHIFKPTEIQMMLAAFSNIETIHIAAYSYLLDTIQMPEIEYQAFLQYKEMRDKYEYMQNWNVDTLEDIIRLLASFSAFTEGLQLFASFAILMSFPRMNKMKGMGQIVTWSVRDETLHVESMIKLFHTFLEENPQLWTKALQQDIYNICREIVFHEDAFISLAFGLGDVESISEQEVRQYIRYIADRRLCQLKLQPIYHQKTNPLPWMDEMLNGIEHANFFETRATEYSRAATQGTWDDAFLSEDSFQE